MNRLLLLSFLLVFSSVNAQVQHDSIPEDDPLILQRIDEWQDLKIGLIIHWGIYSQWGVVESWSICNEDWIVRDSHDAFGRPIANADANYEEYKRAYQGLYKTFNPQSFEAIQWADLAVKAGMRYLVFTTKHHDGFAMFDTRFSDYSVMGSLCPLQRDVTHEVVDAFRSRGLWIGLYFSKPDWHHPDYWAPEWATPDRNVNYDIPSHPERWQRFCDFTYNQIYELTHHYGTVDILWLDGGWVRPQWSVNDACRDWLGCYGRIQDVNISRIAAMARETNPRMIIVDRSVGGRYENYQTPEQQVPDTLLPYPWETCMTLGESWSYSPHDSFKSTRQLIHTLCNIVAFGGNLLLGIGPDADGKIPDTAVQRLTELGEWLQHSGYAIYGTRPLYPYAAGKIRYTQSKDGKHRYSIRLTDDYPYAVVTEL